MTRHRRIADAICAVSLVLSSLIATTASAVDTVTFSTADAGITKSVAKWGVDTAWPNYDNVRLSIASMGSANVDQVRVTFEPTQALVQNGDGTFSLNATAKSGIDSQLSLAAMAGSKPLTFVAGAIPSTFDATNWVRTIKATQEYINSKPGLTTTQISSIEAFNEPDWNTTEGTPANLNTVITQLKTYSAFQNTAFLAGSTLNSDNAQYWYDRVPAATGGSSHLLGGSLTSWVNFADYVKATGKPFVNPELHSLGEAIVGAEHGMTSGTFWADVLRARGLFVQASDGARLGYAEDLGRQSAAAVYRAPNGKIYAFAGGLERFGRATSYHFVATDAAPVYFNGIPTHEFMLQTKSDQDSNATAAGGDDFQNFGSWSHEGAYADVETNAATATPPLDGYRWKIVNVATGQVMQVAGAGTADGALINVGADAGTLSQRWNIVRTRTGYLELFNANSGRTAEIANGSLNTGASMRQWGTADNSIQQWYIDPAGTGSFYLRDAFTNLYATGSSSNNQQYGLLGSANQKWQFVLDNPTTPAKTRYAFNGNVNSSTGVNNAATFGSPTYAAGGPTGVASQAVHLNGSADYLQVPSGAASSNDITISGWVKWDGGSAWQRIFDFGTGTTSYMFLTPKSGDGTMRFGITTTGSDGEQDLETSALPIGQWVNLTLTLGGNTGILYVNGKPRVAGQILLNPSDIASTLNYLGKSQFNDPLFSGSLADFRLYDYALDMSQVAALVPGIWNVNAGGTWSTGTNWLYGSAPDGVDHAVTFANTGVLAQTVSLDGAKTLGSLTFDSAAAYTLGGTGSLTMDGTAGSAAINVNAGSHTINTPLTLSDDTTFTVTPATGTLTVGGTLSATGRTITKAGAGTVSFANVRATALNVNAGTVRIATQPTSLAVAGTSVLSSLSVASGAKLDLANNALVIDYAPGSLGTLPDNVRQMLASGRLTSANAAGNLAVGYLDNASLGTPFTTFGGLGVDTSSLLVGLTLQGDTNLDRSVDFTDLLALAKNYGASGRVWSAGDFDYTGNVDFTDLLMLAKNYSQSLSASDAAMVGEFFAADFALAQSLAPEPASAALVAGVVVFGTLRRRDRQITRARL